ncbi:dentin sialophosphoprotein-like [Arapaima gigas]
MKTAVIFLLLLATVFCHPVKRSASSSESSEEQVKPARSPANPFQSQVKLALPQLKLAPVVSQKVPAKSMTVGSDESSDSSDDAQESDTASDSDGEDNDTEESNESTESEDTDVTTTALPPPVQTTTPPIIYNGRGDSLGYPNDYKKSIIFIETNKIEKGPSPYKSYGINKAEDGRNLYPKKSAVYNGNEGNDIEKTLKVYKAVQVHEEPLEEDTSTPEEESQGLDASSGAAEGENGPAGNHGEVSTEEAETTSTTSESDSASAADGSDSSQSSEEATATPGAADTESSQSSESQESDSAEAETTITPPVVITAK